MEALMIRKDLNSLKPWETERYWACIIYLNILPPKEVHKKTKKFLRTTEVYDKEIESENFSFRLYEPLNRYDEFISSHSSTC